MVTIQNQRTVGALVRPHVYRQFLPVSATRTGLRGVCRIHSHDRSTGAFCLDEEKSEEHRPRYVVYRLAVLSVLDHPVDFEIFNSYETIPVDHLLCRLEDEVLSPVGDSLVDSSYRDPSLPAFGSSFRFLAELSLNLGKFFLVGLEEALTLDLLAVAEGSERGQAYVYAHLFIAIGERFWSFDFARKRSKPLARGSSLDRAGLRFAFHLSVKNDFDGTDFGNSKETVSDFTGRRKLWKRHAVVSELSSEPRVAWSFAVLASAEEGLVGEINSNSYVLQDLCVDDLQRQSRLLQVWNRIYLVVQSRRRFRCFVLCCSFSNAVVPKPPALVKLMLKNASLLLRRIDSILKRLSNHRMQCSI